MSTPETGGMKWCSSSYFLTNTVSERRGLRFISSLVVPKVAQAIEHCDCLAVLRFGADDAQGTFTNQIQIA